MSTRKQTAARKRSPLSGKVQTVLGPVEPSSLGPTLMHEHLLISLECYYVEPEEASERAYINTPVQMGNRGLLRRRWWYVLDEMRLWDERTAIEEVLRFKHAGGGTVVDVTSIGISPDPLALARISRATGLNVVMGGGWYVPLSHPPDMDKRTEDQLAERIIHDVTTGAGDTGIKCGIIGELGNFYPLTANERKVLRAAAHAQAETGAPITIHTGRGDQASLDIIEALTKAGADPKHVAIGHLGPTMRDPKALLALAQTGCFLQYDHFGCFEDTSSRYLGSTDGNISDVQRLEMLEFLITNGHVDQVLVSHDVCGNTHLVRYGGKGYAHLLDNIVPRMRKRGWTKAQTDAVTIHNPARALTFA
ncbi:MAG: phosphotriesterase-related protein [SAR202 cluster bacterium]|nr:phosphotriesterase-related protein [SAR202 cluster bacterium]